jgi:hypothetical protein
MEGRTPLNFDNSQTGELRGPVDESRTSIKDIKLRLQLIYRICAPSGILKAGLLFKSGVSLS